mgnify:CR=1 FL=1
MIDRDKVQAVFLAVLMIGSVVAMSAGTVAAQSSPAEDAAQSALDDIEQTTEQTDSDTDDADGGPSVSAPTQDVEISDGLREKKGEVVVLLSVERSLDRKALASADAETLKADSKATLRPVAQQIGSMEHAEVRKHFWTGNVLSVTVDLSKHDVEDLAAIKGVSSVSPNLDVTLPTPVEPEDEKSVSAEATQNYTYGLEQIGVPAFEEKYGDRGGNATVTVLDDGVTNPDSIHPDLDFDQIASVSDGEVTEGTLGPAGGHGEHVAGTVSGAANPAGDVPRYGVAPNASVNMVNVFEGGTMEDVLAGIEYSVEEDSDVTTLSLGFGSTTGYSTVSNMVEDTVQDANAAGTLVTVSAGNSGSGDAGGPTTSPGAEFSSMSVGASNAQGNIASFSSGDVINPNRVELLNANNSYPEHYPREYVNPDVAAPGVGVISTGDYGTVVEEDPAYSTLSGTSMAAPHVAGAATLLQSVTEEELDPKTIEMALVETAEKSDNEHASQFGRDIRYGAGIINVTAAADALMSGTMAVDGTVTDTGGDPIQGASVYADSDALTSTNASGDYTLHTTQEDIEVTADAFGYEASTKTVSSADEPVDFALEDELATELIEGQRVYAEFGGYVNATVDVRNLESLTVETTEATNVSQDDMTLLVNGQEATFGEAVELDRYNGTAEVRVELADGGDYSENQVIGLEHTLEGLGDTTNVTTGPSKLTEELEPALFDLTDIDAAGAIMVGENLPITVNVTNTGQVAATKDVQMTVSGDAGSGSLPPSSYELRPGETTTVEISAGGVGGLFAPGQEIEAGFRSADSIEQGLLGGYTVTGLNDEISTPVALQAEGTQIEVASLDAPTEVDAGEEVEVTATIQNFGNESGEDTVTFSFDGQTVAEEQVSLGPFNASTTDDTAEVTFNVTAPDESGVYTHSVATSNDSASASLGVGVSIPSVTVVSTNQYGEQTVSLLEQGLTLNGQAAQVSYASASEAEEMMASTDVFVFHNLEGEAGDVIPMVENDPGTTAVYLEQFADANAIAQRSEVTGDPESSVANFGDAGTPVEFEVTQDSPLFDGVAEEGERFAVHTSPQYADYTFFEGADGDTLAEVALEGETPAGPVATVDPDSGSVLLGTIAPNTFEPVDAFTDDAARVLANSVSVAQDGIVTDAVGSTSIDADFVGTVDDAEEVTVTANDVVSDGELVDGKMITFTVGDEPVATAEVENGTATASFDPATLDASAGETLTVSVEEMTVIEADTVETVHETADLQEGYNLLSVPQAADLSADNVSAINTWNTSGVTYETVTQSEFDSASDLHQGLYVSAAADDARLGFTFSDDVPVGGTADLAEGWTLTGSNFPIDSVDEMRDTRTLDEDLIEVDPSELTVFDSGFNQDYDGNSTIGAYEAYWAYNDEAESHERAIISPSYEVEDREEVLGLEESNFTVTNVDATVVPRDEYQAEDNHQVLESDEQAVTVTVTVENYGGLDTQFVDLNVSDERVDRSLGVTLENGESKTVTLTYTLSQDDVPGLTVEALTEDDSATDSVDVGDEGLYVQGQALTLDDEFVVSRVDYNGAASVELVSNGTVLNSTAVDSGTAEDLVLGVNESMIENSQVEVRLLNADGEQETNETVTIEETTIDVDVDNQFAFADADSTLVDVEVYNNALIDQTATINFSADGETKSPEVPVYGDDWTTTTFTVDTSNMSTGDTVDYTATSPDDSATGTLTVAESALTFDNQSVNADGKVLVEDVTASADQKIVITDTDFNVVGEVDVSDMNGGNELIEVASDADYTGPGQYIAHIVANTSDVSDGPGLVYDEATIVDADVTVEDESLDVDESQTAEVSEVTVSTANVEAAPETNFTVEIRQGGDVIGESDTLNGSNSDVTVTLDNPITAEGETEIDAVLVDENGEEFQEPAGETLVDVSDSATVTINVSELSANVALPNQEIGSYNGSDAVLVEDVTGQQDQYVVITDSDLNVVGTHAIEGDVAAKDIVVELDESVEPGEYRAHLTSDVQLVGEDGIVTDTGELYEADLAFEDQEFVGSTDEVEVQTAALMDGMGNSTQFAVAIHENNASGDIIGTATGLTAEESDVTVSLEESIDEEGEYVAMLHFSNDTDALAPINVVDDGSVSTITDGATITPIESDAAFGDQIMTDGQVIVEDVQANTSSTILLTYENDGNTTIAGISEDYEGATPENVTIDVTDEGGFPGEHTAYIIPNDDLSGTYSAGENVSAATMDNATTDVAATVHDAELSIADQTVEDETEEVTVETANLSDGSEFAVELTAGGEVIGESEDLNGSNSGVTVGLTQEINATTDVTATIVDVSGDDIPQATGGNLEPFEDSGIVTVEQAEGGNVDFSSQAMGDDGEVVVENVHPVEGVEVTTEAGVQPQSDFLVLLDSDDEIVDYKQFSEFGDGDDVTLNASGSSPGTHTVAIYEANESGAVRDTPSGGVNASATLYEGNISLSDQEYVESTSSVDLAAATLLDGSNSEFTVNVTNSSGEVIGSETFTGENEDVSVDLDDSISTDGTPITAKIIVDGEVVQQASGTTFQSLTDSATVSIVASNFQVNGLAIGDQGDGATVEPGADPVDISVDVDNTGDIDGTQDIVLTITNASGTTVVQETKSQYVPQGFSGSVTFSDVAVGDLEPGDYDVTVASDDDETTGTLAVQQPASFDVTINDADSSLDVVAGDDAVVNATITNTGDQQAEQTVSLDVGGANEDSQQVDLAGGESQTVEFTFATEAGDDGANVTVSSADDSAQTTLNVDEPANYEITIDSVTEPVTESDEITVEYTVENTGDVEGSPTILFDVNETQEDSTSLIIGGNDSSSGLFTYTTETGDSPNVTVTLTIEGENGDSATETVTVNAP